MMRSLLAILALSAAMALARGASGAEGAMLGPAGVSLDGKPAPPASPSACGFRLVAAGEGPQTAFLGRDLLASVREAEEVAVAVPVEGVAEPFAVRAEAELFAGEEAEVSLSFGDEGPRSTLRPGVPVTLEAAGRAKAALKLTTRGTRGEAAVLWRRVRLVAGGQPIDVPLAPAPTREVLPPPVLPALRPPVERALIEWDWRLQDGIGTERVPCSYAEATETTLRRGDDLLRDLAQGEARLADEAAAWQRLKDERGQLPAAAPEAQWESLWRRVHWLRRRIALANPLAQVGPLLFVKRVPSVFSHQLTQYYGSCARPGGGVFVLDEPGRSMKCRQLAAGALPTGSFLHPEVSPDGRRVLFAFCRAETAPPNRETFLDRFYRLYEMAADGSGLRQLTDGPFDDFSPRCLPNGKILFVSTRRGGFHRCGRGPCPVYTLAVANADGSDPHPISYHETHEWDPAVLHDGRIIYTRWDYVDRHAVYYEQLWTCRPDGSGPAAFYGNNTYNPVGIWEARAVPGSSRVMATAAPHHGMTAGSIILVDVARGVDGAEPITRLTPDAMFPESEVVLLPGWRATAGLHGQPPLPPEAQRWPGHCYRSPFPLSETCFLAAYSFDPLIGEPKPNPPNMFGLYLVDAFGNKELLYRDPSISSQWPVPLRPSPARPPVLAPAGDPAAGPEGTFLVQNVYQSFPPLPQDSVKRLRVLQVLPKSTPHINSPSVGIANASPGKQVLGTVPVEADGSAFFRAPAGLPLAFQALDERGQAVQVMRSITYLQPGENASCVGCHEPRTTTPTPRGAPQALLRPPSAIEPGPEGSKPLSYPLLVQPVLDRHCISCHRKEKPEGKIVLTGEPQGHYTASYNALAPRVSYSAWGRPGNNCEPLAAPGYFGARGSPVLKCFLKSHYDVSLSAEDFDRVVTWMDANALFYGTFDPADQARQLRGERIEGPKIQ